ncbi:MAG TPA: methyltransferase domain-containing protein [Tepidisphaeraceae bacterium]|jgi:phosphatidylethanolamine/phosphatidyl-N-methylethanolamine N-methyltransferase|nr:methyltransferase domain-containing protein [Tepidisphaeraceae bacterium]
MQEASTKKIYDVQSSFYDATFGKLVKRRIEEAVRHMNISDTDRVLDLGIGTGASLNYYPNRGRIIGVDLSEGMLRECRKKIEARGLDHATVFRADAMHLPFDDDTFDHVFISHVISVVSDPFKLVQEAQRVAKEGARIVIVNHFQSTNRFLAMLEKLLCPLCVKLGWRSDLPLQDLVRRTGIQVDYRFKLESIDLWETVVISNNKSAIRREPIIPSQLPMSGRPVGTPAFS